jgi:uncharacterized protein (TIGR02246 family)
MQTLKLILFLTALTISNGLWASNNSFSQITNQINLYVEGWASQSGEDFARPFSRNSVFINIFATRFDGKDAIAQRHQEIFDTFLRDTTIEVLRTDIKKISKNVAIVYVDWTLNNLTCIEGRPCPRNGTFTHVFKKKHGKWRIVSTQNTHITP